jgi:hypothetical protein
MAWTAPKTWATDDDLDATTLNTQIRDNLLRLHNNSNSAFKEDLTERTFSSGSSSYAQVSGTDITITTDGGVVILCCVFAPKNGGASNWHRNRVTFYRDGATDLQPSGWEGLGGGTTTSSLSDDQAPKFIFWIDTGLGAGTYRYDLYFQCEANLSGFMYTKMMAWEL